MKSKFQIKIEPVNEKVHEKDFEKRRQLHCYECESYSHLQQQQDKLMKNFETIASNEIETIASNEIDLIMHWLHIQVWEK